MGFMDDYEPVDDRIHKFWAKHPEGRIATELIFDADARVVFLAQIWRTQGDGRPDSTGWSEERQASSKINKMNYVEIGETSAIGRALANLGFSAKGARPSREEMQKEQRHAPAGKVTPIDAARRDPDRHDGAPTDVLRNRISTANDSDKAAIRQRFEKAGWPNPLPDSLSENLIRAISQMLDEVVTA